MNDMNDMNDMGEANTKTRSKYKFYNVIGRGSFGIVYLALDKLNNRLVAIKVGNRKLYAEKDLMTKIGIDCYDMWNGNAGAKVYMVLPLYGASIRSIVKDELSLTTELACNILYKMLQCIEKSHSAQVIHRDIKPDNFLVSYKYPCSELHLIDYGLSKIFTPQPDKPIKVGSANYMSVNIINKIDASYRDDLFSLVYTYIYLLRGSLPWSAAYVTSADIVKVNNAKKQYTASSLADLSPCQCVACRSIIIKLYTHAFSLQYHESLDFKYLYIVIKDAALCHSVDVTAPIFW